MSNLSDDTKKPFGILQVHYTNSQYLQMGRLSRRSSFTTTTPTTSTYYYYYYYYYYYCY